MKKIIFLLLTIFISISAIYAQNKNYLSIEYGRTYTGMGNSITNNMKTNDFGDQLTYNFIHTFLDDLNGGTRQYPLKDSRKANCKLRYGYNIKKNASIEAGLGRIFHTIVNGADASGKFVNYLTINCELSTVYAAYIMKNKKGNVAIGIGPAVSICTIKQTNTESAITLSHKRYLLPGVIFTGYWNFVNQKSWFMGLRTDMTITTPAKTKAVSIAYPDNISFVSVSKTASIGSVMNTVSLSAGIKF